MWTYNGQVFVKVAETDERRQVSHIDDVDDLFNDATHSVSANEDDIDATNVYDSTCDQPGTRDDNLTQTRQLGHSARRLATISKQILVLLN